MLTGEQATDIAMKYLKKTYAFMQIKTVKQENNKWILEFNVSLSGDKTMRVTLNASKGTVEKVEQVK
jgi:hypothetical protein